MCYCLTLCKEEMLYLSLFNIVQGGTVVSVSVSYRARRNCCICHCLTSCKEELLYLSLFNIVQEGNVVSVIV